MTTNKAFDLEKSIVTLKNTQSEKEEAILNLKKMILDKKDQSPFYAPSGDDVTDVALGTYINNLTDPGRIKYLFIREGEGIYQFGSKKIYVKTENDKILSINIRYSYFILI